MKILMARTVKYTVNFLEADEEDLHRSANASYLLLIFMFCIACQLLVFRDRGSSGGGSGGEKVACQKG